MESQFRGLAEIPTGTSHMAIEVKAAVDLTTSSAATQQRGIVDTIKKKG